MGKYPEHWVRMFEIVHEEYEVTEECRLNGLDIEVVKRIAETTPNMTLRSSLEFCLRAKGGEHVIGRGYKRTANNL